ncbi:hypothetical protein RHGRI_026677 [Rhododendron griersonianum]|uniref:HMG-Y-related protein A n=1 Tax=Rhododendron griersonianum TaxID=479676 RepID=A0AAV6IZ86_9ERIC|nr:hypothetical protein RHGRI_026677 [Rhododendron griersonianum]
MAAEQSNNPPPQPPLPPPTLPLYPEMIMAAIEALNDESGSNKSAISRQIEATYGELPAAHTTLLSHHLNKMKQGGQLVMVKNNYMKPDPNAPPRRGRGRPPKPKTASSLPTADAVASPPRPRGRPPKARDPFAPPSEAKAKPASSGRPRGRPPKKAKVESAVEGGVTSAAPARGRGRPPKVKQEVVAAPVEC